MAEEYKCSVCENEIKEMEYLWRILDKVYCTECANEKLKSAKFVQVGGGAGR
jgi:hypothetical protein